MVNTIFILDKTYNTTQILVGDKSSQRMFWDDLYTQEFDTGAETFEFSCYLDENVVEGNYVAFYYNNQYKLFTIMDMEQTHKKGRLVANCYCEIASLSLLNNYVRPFSGDVNCIQFFEHILNGTDWHIGRYSTSLRNRVETIKVTKIESVWSLIEDYKDIFECEINVRVTYENGHVTGQYIDIYSDGGLGSSTLKRFEYGRNVTGITKKKELYDWCTGIILDVDCDVSDTVIEERDGYGFTKGAGDIILNDNANRMYNAGRNYVIGVYEGDETEPVEACINAWKELKKRSTPRFDYEVTTALTEDEYEEVHLGDTVYVVDRSYTPPLFLEARVGKLELSFTDRTQNKCVLTNYKEIKSKLLDADYIKLTGTITDIVNAFFPITSEGIADGAIVDGKIETTYFQQITADIVSASVGAFEDLYVQGMTVINADIENLKATNADIGSLKAKVAEIDTLINGHLTSDNIQSLILTADKVTVEDAFIKNAMIDTISAEKINTGVLNTNNVSIQSDDGSMLLQGNLQQFKDSSGKVRIQIGKDANGDFTFALFSQDGVGILIDENGIKEGAIGDGLIVDSMVSDNANIQGGKLDINSVITSINNGTTTINSSRIYLDEEGQSLKVAFDQLKTKVETIENITVDGDLSSVIEQVTSNTTNINIMQGEISSLISNTTITKENGEVVQLKDEYNSTKDTVDSHTTKIGSLETTVNDVTSKQASMELDLNGFRTEVSNTYATKTQLNTTNSNVTTAQNTANTAKNTADSALSKANTNASNITTVSNKQSSLEQTVDNFKTTVSSTYATKDELTGLGSSYVTKTEFNQTNEDFTFKISQGGGGNLLRNSDFYDVMNEKWDYWNFWGNCYQYTDIWLLYESFVDAMIIDNQSTSTQGGFYQEVWGIRPNVEYTFSVNLSWADNVNAVVVAVEYYSADGTRIGSIIPNNIENNIDTRQSFTFTTPADCVRINVVFNHNGSTNGSSAFYIIQRPCLVEGYGSVWVPHSKEMYDGIVKIDKYGLTVQHGTNSTVMDSDSFKIKVGSDTHAQIKDGQFTFTDASGNNKLGRVGRSYWDGTTIGMTSLGASYGNTIALSAQHTSGGNYITGAVCSSYDQWIGDSYYYQGIDITTPVITSRMCFRDTYANRMQTYNGVSIGMLDMWAINDSSMGYGGAVIGNNFLRLGTYSSATANSGFLLREDNTQTNGVAIHGYGPLNMHGFSITNSSSTMSLNAQSEYTRSLLSTGTNEQISYSGLNYNSDEIRWCWKENVFTYQDCDVDPVTDEWVYYDRYICYIELPIFMAENIEADYHINVSKMSWGDWRIREKNQYYFILESQEEDFAFTFEVVAKLKDGATITNNAIVANNSVDTEVSVSVPQDIGGVVDPVDSINIQENINIGEE